MDLGLGTGECWTNFYTTIYQVPLISLQISFFSLKSGPASRVAAVDVDDSGIVSSVRSQLWRVFESSCSDRLCNPMVRVVISQ